MAESCDAIEHPPAYAVHKCFGNRVENHVQEIIPHFMPYNSAWIHRMLRIPPATEAGISNHGRDIQEIAAFVGLKSVEGEKWDRCCSL